MITFTCRNANGVEFEKEFSSPYQARVFYLRCKHSKKITIVRRQYSSYSVQQAVEYGY